VCLSPAALEVFGVSIPLRIDLLVVFRSMMCLGEQFRWGGCLTSVLISWPCDCLSRSLNVTVIPQPHVGLFRGEGDHWKLWRVSRSPYHTWLDCLRLRMNTELPGAVTVDDITVMAKCQRCRSTRFCRCSISGLGCTGSFLSSKILLGEALLPCFSLPVVISYSPSINNNSAAKLPEHRFCSDNRYLP
jgi:hypothetical protein